MTYRSTMQDVLAKEEDFLMVGDYRRKDGKWFDPIRRARKRWWVHQMDGYASQALYIAYNLGQYDSFTEGRRTHHYPPGKRRDEYERGFRRG